MRIVTWNINGLRACLKRRFDGKLIDLLRFLEADIVCFQETKLARQEVTEDLALAEGWESFFSYCRTRGGYSGVATFCRSGVTVAALDGFSGVLPQGPTKSRDTPPLSAAQDALNAPCISLLDRFSQEELERLDAEGRVVITDHGAFVLVNVYGPAITSEESAEERYAFKLRFYEGLLHRIQALRATGRCVILLGDLNISLAPMDSCDPGPIDAFNARTDRRLLTQLLTTNGGPFLDVFRKFHPDRREAYTCWSTASGARINNYGTRIDLILAAGPDGAAAGADFHGLFTAADLWMDAQGSDHAPAWAELAPHACLAVADIPPPLCTRYQFTGKQGNLRLWLSGSASATQCCVASQSSTGSRLSAPASEEARRQQPTSVKRASSQVAQKPGKAPKRQAGPGQRSLRAFMKPQAAQTTATQPSQQSQKVDLPTVGETDTAAADEKPSCAMQHQENAGIQGAGAGSMAACEAEQPEACTASAPIAFSAASAAEPRCNGSAGKGVQTWNELQAQGIPGADDFLAEAAANWDSAAGAEEDACELSEKNTAAKAVWKQIQDRMKPPLCKGHGEPCVIRQVKKSGVNQGRVFYVCRRAAGNPPVGRCDHFAWAADRQMRRANSQKGATSMSLKQAWN
ncbi:probable DNA-(apurinic or apyrimidinic site) lyase 2 [Coccomyxa sp. Obi]|nr:probable DNA-(apurinic or apyrimidinic site) lyase 2 [Coccomyxa sp. Obi]